MLRDHFRPTGLENLPANSRDREWGIVLDSLAEAAPDPSPAELTAYLLLDPEVGFQGAGARLLASARGFAYRPGYLAGMAGRPALSPAVNFRETRIRAAIATAYMRALMLLEWNFRHRAGRPPNQLGEHPLTKAGKDDGTNWPQARGPTWCTHKRSLRFTREMRQLREMPPLRPEGRARWFDVRAPAGHNVKGPFWARSRLEQVEVPEGVLLCQDTYLCEYVAAEGTPGASRLPALSVRVYRGLGCSRAGIA